MWKRVGEVEDNKYDLEYKVRQKDFEVGLPIYYCFL